MHPILFHLGDVSVYSHGFMILSGIVLAGVTAYFLAKRSGLRTSNLIDNFTSAVLVGIIFARITFDLVYIRQLKSFWEAFYIWQGGLISWGGFLAGFVVLVILIKKQKEPLWQWLDVLGVSALLGIGVGRIGCVWTGDIAGRLTSNYPHGFPVAFYESVFTSLLFVAILATIFFLKKIPVGFRFVYALLGYSLIRLVIDGYRDLPLLFIGLNSSQIAALSVVVLVSVVFLLRIINRTKK